MMARIRFFVAERDDLRRKGHAGGQPQKVAREVAGGQIVRKGERAAEKHRQRDQRLQKRGLFLFHRNGKQEYQHRSRILQHNGRGSRGQLDGAHIQDAGQAFRRRAEKGPFVDVQLKAPAADAHHNHADGAPRRHNAEGRPRNGLDAHARQPPQKSGEDDVNSSFGLQVFHGGNNQKSVEC